MLTDLLVESELDLAGSENEIQAALKSKIGPWSEVKLEIIRKYAHAYSVILSAPGQKRFHHVYADAFAGAGSHLSRASGEIVPGSPKIALETIPPFAEYHFVDIQHLRVQALESIADNRTDVFVHHGDANEVLIHQVLPRIKYEEYRRGLCLLDPYGMHYEWRVVEAIGKMRTIDLFLNFPIMDINMNALRRDSVNVTESQVRRMTRFWGDESWRRDFYSPNVQLGLFGGDNTAKVSNNDAVVYAYIERLKRLAGFSYVPAPLPMTNSIGRTVYYLIFAAHNRAASSIVEQIFEKYRT